MDDKEIFALIGTCVATIAILGLTAIMQVVGPQYWLLPGILNVILVGVIYGIYRSGPKLKLILLLAGMVLVVFCLISGVTPIQQMDSGGIPILAGIIGMYAVGLIAAALHVPEEGEDE